MHICGMEMDTEIPIETNSEDVNSKLSKCLKDLHTKMKVKILIMTVNNTETRMEKFKRIVKIEKEQNHEII